MQRQFTYVTVAVYLVFIAVFLCLAGLGCKAPGGKAARRYEAAPGKQGGR